MRAAIIFTSILFASLVTFSQEHSRVLILGGVAHIGNGTVVNNPAISIKDGVFQYVKNRMVQRIDETDFDTVIQLGKVHIYPGLIAANTPLGLTEIEAVRATLDFKEVGEMNPNVRALIAYDAESAIIPTVRFNGVLVAQVVPRGAIFSGTSSIFNLSGNNWEDAVFKEDDGVHLYWPNRFRQTGWWAEPGTIKSNASYNQKLEALQDFMARAKGYGLDLNSTQMNLKLEAMKGVFNGSKTLFVHANEARELIQAVQLKREFDIEKMVIVGGYDAWRISELLNDYHVPVIYHRTHSLPRREDEPIDLPYRIPALMKKRGIEFCLSMSDDHNATENRNLPFNAGSAATYGLGKEEALQAVTGDAAKILGIDTYLGTLEPGKYATFFISEGDVLDMKSNAITHVYIQGKPVPVDGPQQELYHKWVNHYKP